MDLIRNDTAAAGRQIASVLGFDDVAFLDQAHGGRAIVCRKGGLAGSADGLLTATAGLALLGKSGDCPIVLIADRQHRAVGFAHASWRATVAGIVPAVVGQMVALNCRPAELVACICPSAGPQCYEVGVEVRAAAVETIGPRAEAFFKPGPRGKDHFDLWAANVDALIQSGLSPRSIHVAGICTLCRNDLFPSHRREGETAGRFAVVMGLPRDVATVRGGGRSPTGRGRSPR